MKKLIAYTISVICLVCLCASVISADSMVAPYPYVIELGGGSLEFHMTPDENWYELAEGEIVIDSGLYSVNADGSLENIYTVNEYFYDVNMIMSSDGKYFAVIPWADADQDTVITFYKDGKIQKSYGSSELMKDIENREYTASHYFWEKSDKRTFDDSTNLLSVTTLDGMTYTFDITTGEIISAPAEASENRLPAVITGICILAVVLVVVGFFSRSKRKSS